MGRDMKDKLFQIPAAMTSYKSMSAGSIKFTFETQELIQAEHLALMCSYLNKVGNLLFAVRELELDDMQGLDKVDAKKYPQGKTPSQRLRNVIYVLHQQRKGKPEDFEKFYDACMEKIIDRAKGKLEEQ